MYSNVVRINALERVDQPFYVLMRPSALTDSRTHVNALACADRTQLKRQRTRAHQRTRSRVICARAH
jgi:hypothetical protein